MSSGMRWEYEDQVTFDISPDLYAGSQVVNGVRMYAVHDDGSPVRGMRVCPTCYRAFLPLNEDRTLCASCVRDAMRMKQADATWQELAFGKDWR